MIWTWTQPQKFFGLELGARMTAVDIDGQGTLLIHSPIRPTEAIIGDLKSKGRVAYVVAPNKWHHLYVGDFKNAFPEARIFCAPGLDKKRPDFQFERVITGEQNFPWNPYLSHALIEGAPMFNEVAFFHARSRSLILTDTALHICENSPLVTKIFFALAGTYKKFGLSALEKKMFIQDRELFTRSMGEIAKWNFDRIVVSHGKVVETDGKARFTSAYL